MKILLKILIAVIPLIVSFSTIDPTLSIRFLVLSLFVSGVLLYYLFAKKTIPKEIIAHPAMLVFGAVIVCYLFSAFINGIRSESIYVVLKLFLFYLFTIIVIDFVKDKGCKPLFNSFIYFSLFLSAIYFLQIIINYSEIIAIDSAWKRNHMFDEIAATMGHKNLLSSIQFLLLPILIYVLISARGILKFLSSLAIVLIIGTLFQTQTRAVLFAVVIFSLSMLILNKKTFYKKHFVLLLFIGALLFVSGFAVMKVTNRYDAFVGEINKTLDFTSSSRYRLYNSSLKLIVDHPLFGVGPGNWKVDVWEYGLYEGNLGKSFAQRPHNDFLWVFSEGGFLAGISYILLFLILLRESYLLHKNRDESDGVFYSLLFSTFLGYVFISLVDFPMERISHNIIFFVLAAFVIAGRIKDTKDNTPLCFKLSLISISLFIVYVAAIRYHGEVHTANARHNKSQGNWNDVIKSINEAHNSAYYELENTATPLLWYRGVAYFNQKKYSLALKDFEQAYIVNPFHVHVLNNLATSWQMKGDSKKAKKYYRDVFKVNPTFKESRVNLAAILFNEKEYVDALDVILKSKVDPYWKRNQNNDNYDLYLKTIVDAWINSVYNTANNEEKRSLDSLKVSFEQWPKGAALKLRTISKLHINNDVSYLNALMLF